MTSLVCNQPAMRSGAQFDLAVPVKSKTFDPVTHSIGFVANIALSRSVKRADFSNYPIWIDEPSFGISVVNGPKHGCFFSQVAYNGMPYQVNGKTKIAPLYVRKLAVAVRTRSSVHFKPRAVLNKLTTTRIRSVWQPNGSVPFGLASTVGYGLGTCIKATGKVVVQVALRESFNAPREAFNFRYIRPHVVVVVIHHRPVHRRTRGHYVVLGPA